jgi:hypothetical protein
MAKIIVGCRLPNGLVLTHPKSGETVTLAGLHSSKIIGATHVSTEVDSDFWEAWKASMGNNFTPLKTGAIFEARSETDALAKAKELRKENTGFEPMGTDGKDPRASGVKKADK